MEGVSSFEVKVFWTPFTMERIPTTIPFPDRNKSELAVGYSTLSEALTACWERAGWDDTKGWQRWLGARVRTPWLFELALLLVPLLVLHWALDCI